MSSIETWSDFLTRRKSAIDAFAEKFGHLQFAIAYIPYEDDRSYSTDEPKFPKARELTNAEEIIDCLKERNLNWQTLETEEQLIAALQDSHNDVWFVEPLAAYQKRKQEHIRQTLEAEAAEIAIKYGCLVNSLDFLDACQAEMERFQDYRAGMQEDGLCIGYGVSREQWYEEFSESRGDSDRIQKIIDWIATNLPLLYGQWQYQQQTQTEI
ncbi:hypothetical protein FD723_40245 (plasmid) [Nostoc sp. C052]|uniref:hypothetical protein n=1 Tax=Nostoc sp. C052 TaxID=2576902 RepID=UPI0015C3F2F2|nr:hypothetical protein [Nostoc sp. C052]QLE46445.1 hypothetical protein FD723_40245 [Nostoc sp. C052]